ncbi:YciI family protein [Nocardiopsis sp. RSe5-2]|uniref:YciI family protein n=1 Tax=Nocardiopsis endophytica TaxID=3018445 RepID=A0ABT4U8T9_9ACTN|nr:YciI family protein [Nocardiopsis endophytica]MDA2813368.1 YciI family protein [Nocardiopsis endophytica]
MKFALVILENTASRRSIERDRAAHRKAIEAWMGETAATGRLVGGDAFETEETAPVTVRAGADGARAATEGSAVPGDETLGGYILVETAGRDEAVEIARTWPTPETIEVRPVMAG